MSGRSVVARALCIAAGTALVLAGCANNESTDDKGSSSGSETVSVKKDDTIAAGLPDKVKNAGKLVVGVNVPYPPNEFKKDGKLVGFDVDLMNAVAQVLGVTAEYVESDFDKIIPAIQAGTYDVGMSSFTDKKERETQVDFTTYFKAGVQWAQQAGKPIDPNDACGKKVAVQSTTFEETEEVPAKSAACVAAGKPPIEILKYDAQDDAANALAVGKADAMSADSPVTNYAIKQSGGKLEKAGPEFEAEPYGWPSAKGGPLAPVLQKAMQKLIDDGTAKTIATNWGVEAGLIEKSEINAAVS